MQRASSLRERVLRAHRAMGEATHREIARCTPGWELAQQPQCERFQGLWEESLHCWGGLLGDGRAHVRDFAVQSLPLLPTADVTPLVVGALGDRSPRVQRSAYTALGACGPYARPQLSDLVGQYLSMWPRSQRQRRQRSALRGCLQRLAPHTHDLSDDPLRTMATTEGRLAELCELLRLPSGSIPHQRRHSGFVTVGAGTERHAGETDRLSRMLNQLEHPIFQLGLHTLEELLPMGATIGDDAAAWVDLQLQMEWYREAFGRPSREQRRLQEVFKECLYAWLVCGGLPLLRAWLEQPESIIQSLRDEYGVLAVILFFGTLCKLLSRR